MNADECERMAQRSPLPRDRESFRKAAQEWRDLALQSEHKEMRRK